MYACILDQGRKGDGAASLMISPEIVLRHGKDLALVLERVRPMPRYCGQTGSRVPEFMEAQASAQAPNSRV
jgi:hypothetical protein